MFPLFSQNDSDTENNRLENISDMNKVTIQ